MANSTTDIARVPELVPGLTPFLFKNNLTAGQLAASETHVLSPKFGPDVYLWVPSLFYYAPTELDSDATPAITFSFGYGGSDGVHDDEFIAAAAFGQADKSNLLVGDLAADTPLLVDMEDLYLTSKVETGPDVAVAGEVWVGGLLWVKPFLPLGDLS